MERGAVAMFDALGWKGIWQRRGVNHDEIIAKVRGLRDHALSQQDWGRSPELQGLVDSPVRIACFSDTIAIGMPQNDRENSAKAALLVAAFVTANVIIKAAETSPPLAYRGVITHGEFLIDDRYVLGKAIDEAAELMDLANAAIVWLSPSATSILGQYEEVPEQPLHSWGVPLKETGDFKTLTINPFSHRAGARADRLEEAILSSFDKPRIDVQVKKQNTARFLGEMRRRSVAPTSNAG